MLAIASKVAAKQVYCFFNRVVITIIKLLIAHDLQMASVLQ